MKNTNELYNNFFSGLFLLILLCILNQLKIKNIYINYIYLIHVVFFSSYIVYFIFKKKLNLNNIKNNYILLFVTIIIFVDFLINKNFFDLKISVYLGLCIVLSYIISEIREDMFLKLITFSSLIFLLYGVYGWLNGGEGTGWGKLYVYFAYNYLPSTRNEDSLIFLLGFITSLYLFLFTKFNYKILLINQLNILAIILSFSRGMYLLIFLNLIMLIFYIISNTNKFKFVAIYLIGTLLIQFSSIQIINKSTEMDLNSVFVVKLQSFNHLGDSTGNTISKKNYTYLLNSSRNSSKIKIKEWKNFMNEIKVKMSNDNYFFNLVNKFFVNKKKYYENSVLYILGNFSIFLSFVILIFILKNTLKIKNNFEYSKDIFKLVIFVNFILLNTIYNYLDDIWNYLIILYLITPNNQNFKISYK